MKVKSIVQNDSSSILLMAVTHTMNQSQGKAAFSFRSLSLALCFFFFFLNKNYLRSTENVYLQLARHFIAVTTQ